MVRAQLSLFDMPEAPPVMRVGPAPVEEAIRDLSRRLPPKLRLGTSSWTFNGWAGLVYNRESSARVLAYEGLSAYAQHPLFRTVSIDRTFYGPVPAETFRQYGALVPDEFEFVVKAHEWCTWARFPDHARYGASRGKANPFYLDAEYARREVIEPARVGLGPRLGVLLFQFPPQDLDTLGRRRGFVRDLEQFLAALPRGLRYSFEFRTHQLFCAEVIDVLRQYGATHTFSAHPAMHELHHQLRHVDPQRDAYTVIRWMLTRHYGYEEAKAAYAPFDRLVEPDVRARASILEIIRAAGDQPVYVLVNNKAEGSAPLSIERLASELVGAPR